MKFSQKLQRSMLDALIVATLSLGAISHHLNATEEKEQDHHEHDSSIHLNQTQIANQTIPVDCPGSADFPFHGRTAD